MIRLHTLRTEFGPTIRLALPLVLAELGWMSMAIVDTVMVGHLPDSATAMGAVSLSSNIFIVLALFGGGLLLGLDTLVAQAFGAGQREDCHRSLLNGIYLSIALTPLMATPDVVLRPRAGCDGDRSADHRASRSVHERAGRRPLPAAALFRGAPLPASDEHGEAGGLRAWSAPIWSTLSAIGC